MAPKAPKPRRKVTTRRPKIIPTSAKKPASLGPRTQRLLPKPRLGNPFLEAYLGKPVVLPSSGVNCLKPLPSEDTFTITSSNFDLAVHPAYDGLTILRQHDPTALSATSGFQASRAWSGDKGMNILSGAQIPILADATAIKMTSGSVSIAPMVIEVTSGALLVPENKGSTGLHRHLYRVDAGGGNLSFHFNATLGRELAPGETIGLRLAVLNSGLATVASAVSPTHGAGAGTVFAQVATIAAVPAAAWMELEIDFVIDSPVQMHQMLLDLSGTMSWSANLMTRALYTDRTQAVEGVSRGARTIVSRLCATLSYTGDLVKSGTIASTVLPAAASGRVIMSYDDITTDTTTRYRTGSVGKGCHQQSALNNVSQHYYDTARYSELHENWASLYFSVRANDAGAIWRLRVGSMIHVIPTVQYHTVPKVPYVQHQLDEFGTIMSTMPLMMENPSHLKVLANYVRDALKDAPEYAARLGDIAQAVTKEIIRIKGMAGTLV